jgi:hypothetical protein
MTAVVAMQNVMSHEYEKQYNTANSNAVIENNGTESKLHENVNLPSSLEAEAEEETTAEKAAENAPKGSAKRKSDNRQKTFCEEFLGNEINSSQQEAINRLSTEEGIQSMIKWLENARNEEKSHRLCLLLAQCWKADIGVNLLTKHGIGKLVREFKKHPNKEVQKAATEVVKKWKNVIEEYPLQTKPATQAPAAQSKLPPAASTAPKPEIKNEPKNRPKTARTKTTKFRKTGFEGDDDEEEDPPVKKPATTIASRPSASVSKPLIPKKLPGVAAPSNSFMQALSAGSSVNAVELQRRRKKPTPVIDLPLTAPGVN